MKFSFRTATSAIALVAVAAAAAGADDSAALEELLEPMAKYAAEFEQVVIGARGQTLQTVTGTMHLHRPGRFRWEVADPYPQLVMTDGVSLYIFDPDLEQVTVAPLAESMQGSPARLLTESVDDVDTFFTVLEEATADGAEGRRVFLLTPIDDASLFRQIRLKFDAKLLTGIDIIDHLDQATRITFTNPRIDPVLESGLFEFVVPEGTDVIGDVPSRDSSG